VTEGTAAQSKERERMVKSEKKNEKRDPRGDSAPIGKERTLKDYTDLHRFQEGVSDV